MTTQKKNANAHEIYVSKEQENFTKTVGKATLNIATTTIPGGSFALTFYGMMTDYKKKALQNKAELFLSTAKVDETEFNDFINSLDEEKRQFLMESIFDLLFASDEKEKINLYAFLFKDCVQNSTDFELYARCVQAIKSSFIVDIAQLGKYGPNYWDNSEFGSRLLFLGLLREVGQNLGTLDGEPASTCYEHTEVGKHLLKVLEENHWDKLVI